MRRLSAFILCVAALTIGMNAATTDAPDFAFPRKVITDSQKMLDNALKHKDGKATVDAFIRLTLASTSLSSDEFPKAIALADSVSEVCNDEVTSDMISLLEADLWMAMYQADSYNLDQRTDVEGSVPDDITLWSGAQIKKRISEIYDQVMDDEEILRRAKTSEWKAVIKADDTTLRFYPTLFDFACSKAINALRQIDDLSLTALPESMLTNPPSAEAIPARVLPLTRQVLVISDRWVTANPRPTAARIAALISRQNVLETCVAYSGNQNAKIDARFDLYEANKSCPEAIEIILQSSAINNFGSPEENVRTYNILSTFKAEHPDYFNISAVNSALNQMERTSISVDTPTQFAKGVPEKATIHVENVKHASFTVYRINNFVMKDDRSHYKFTSMAALTKAAAFSADFEGNVPFSADAVKDLTLDQYGAYIIINDAEKPKKGDWLKVLFCSDMSVTDITYSRNNWVWVSDITTGEPVENVLASVTCDKQTENGRTDAEGFVGLKTPLSSYSWATASLSVSNGDDRYFIPITYSVVRNRPSDRYAASVMTDLAVYRPGDKIEFVGIIYRYEGNTVKAVPDAGTCQVVLRDVNYAPVDTLMLRPDETGRIYGRLTIPTEGLTGRYSIIVSMDDYMLGAGDAMVSDYKLPTFTVNLDDVQLADDGTVSVAGSAMTYAGTPVGDADVTLALSSTAYRWWRGNTVSDFAVMHANTGTDGRFSIDIDAATIADAPYPQGVFDALVTIISPAGETEIASTAFTVAAKSSVNILDGKAITVNGSSTDAVTINNPLRRKIDADVTLTFTLNDKEYSFKGRCEGDKCLVDLSNLPSGTYKLSVTADNPDILDATADAVVVYNPASKLPPTSDLLWLTPQSSKVTAGQEARRAAIIYSTARDSAVVNMAVFSDSTLIERRIVHPVRGINTLEIDMPAGIDKAMVYIFSSCGGEYASVASTIKIDNPADDIHLQVNNLRDHVTPLTTETVEFKLVDGDGNPVDGALILDVYNKALDAIAMPVRFFNPRGMLNLSASLTRMASNQMLYNQFLNWSAPYRYQNLKIDLTAPAFNLYGRSFGPTYSKRSMYLMSASPVMYDDMADDANMLGAREDVESSASGSADQGVDEEEIAEETAPKVDLNDKSYRPSEIALAMFRPNAVIKGANGAIVPITYPDANTTWVYDAIAYTSEMRVARSISEIIAAKPVIVNPNLPRFFRTGDNAVIAVTSTNNSDSEAAIRTTFEVIDPETATVIRSYEARDTVAANTSVTNSFDVDTTIGRSALIIRAKAATTDYSDGEQAFLPVLPSSQQVMDSHTFYIPNDDLNFSTALPTPSENATLTLSVCENPTWEVVSALPGLRTSNAGSAFGASSQIFSAYVSAYVMDLNPQVEKHLKEWIESAGDDALALSMLGNDSQLKQMVLASTPWVQAAASDAERISRLALLFDRKEIRSSLNEGLALLRKCRRSDGGIAWMPKSDYSSMWATMNMLDDMARLRTLGISTAAADDIVRDAWKWVDSEIVKEYRRHPDGDYLDYARMRSLFTDMPISAEAQRVINATVQTTVANWKNYSTIRKAYSAMLLNGNGYKRVAAEILSSLREFASTSPEWGMWWPSVDGSTYFSLRAVNQTAVILQAFNAVEPESTDVDLIRRWLILNKTVQDWGSSVYASTCVTAILGCGSNWLSKPGEMTVTVDGHRVVGNPTDMLTGSFSADISGSTGNLDIARTAEGPAWGSVIETAIKPMDEIAAHSLPELSITKQMLVSNAGGEWTVYDEAATVGQTMRIRLIISANRDMDYMVVKDNRAAALEPVIQTPRYVWCDGVGFYLENRDDCTNLFIDRLPAGQYILEYDMRVNNAGSYASGIATIQSQQAPELTAHSSGCRIAVSPR